MVLLKKLPWFETLWIPPFHIINDIFIYWHLYRPFITLLVTYHTVTELDFVTELDTLSEFRKLSIEQMWWAFADSDT